MTPTVRPHSLLLAVACAAVLAIALPAGAATVGTDLGGMNESGYCVHLSFGHSGLAASQTGPNKAFNNWRCFLPKGSTTIPIDIQAACEFTYTQRPILAEARDPDDAFSWHCFQTPTTTPPGLTGTTVRCDFIVAAASDTCFATVSDNGLPAKTPTGTVDFYSSGGGVFTAGPSCKLKSDAANQESCSVSFLPPSGPKSVIVAGTYGGDRDGHSTSTGQARVLSLTVAKAITASGTGTASATGAVSVGIDCKIPCQVFAELAAASSASVDSTAAAAALGRGHVTLKRGGRGKLKIQLTPAERQHLKLHHIKRFTARLKITLRTVTGHLIGSRTTRITIRVP